MYVVWPFECLINKKHSWIILFCKNQFLFLFRRFFYLILFEISGKFFKLQVAEKLFWRVEKSFLKDSNEYLSIFIDLSILYSSFNFYFFLFILLFSFILIIIPVVFVFLSIKKASFRVGFRHLIVLPVSNQLYSFLSFIYFSSSFLCFDYWS